MHEIIINTSRDRILKYCEEHLSKNPRQILSEAPDNLENHKIFFLAKPLPTLTELEQLTRLYKTNDVHLVHSDGTSIVGNEIMNYIKIMTARHEGINIRKQELSQSKLTQPPEILTIEPSHLCNLKCPHCSTGMRLLKRDKKHLDIEVAKQLIMDTAGKSFSLTMPHEGEPFIQPDIVFELTRTAKKYYMNVDLATNGHYFTESNIKKIVDEKISSVTVTIDGMTEETYQKYRVGGSLNKVKEGLRNLARYRNEIGALVPHIRVQMIMMKHNLSEWNRLAEFAQEINADSYGLKTMALIDFKQKNLWLPNDLSKVRKRYHFDKESHYNQFYHKTYSCRIPWKNMWINSDCKILGCTFDWRSQYPMAKAEGQNLMEIWNNDSYVKFRQDLLDGIGKAPLCKAMCKGDFDESHITLPEIPSKIAKVS